MTKKITKSLKAAYKKLYKQTCEKLNERYYDNYIEDFKNEHDLTLTEKQQAKLDKLMKKDLRQELSCNMDYWQEEFAKDCAKVEAKAELYYLKLDYSDILDWGYSGDFNSKKYKFQEHWEDICCFYDSDTYYFLESLIA